MAKFVWIQKDNMDNLPKSAGVYAFKNKNELLYIGKAANIRDRVRNHFMQPNYRDHFFIEDTEKLGYIQTDSEIEALLLEAELIKKENPRHNIMWRDDKNYFYVGLSKDALPRVFLTHQPQTVKKAVGPFVDGKAIKRTLRSLRKVFPYYTAKKHGAKQCQYCHLGLCPGPTPDEKEYKKSVQNLLAVLQGKRQSVLKKLQKEMAQASKEQEYEKAKALRDQLQDLEAILENAKVFRPTEEKQEIDWPFIEKYLQKILSTKQKISRVESYDISNIQGIEATGSMPVFIKGKPSKEHYRKFKVHLVYKKDRGIGERSAGTPRSNTRQSQVIGSDPNDFAMLVEVLSRRLAHKDWPKPDLLIIDGGKPQLSAALKALGKKNILVVSIAKKNNELFLPGKRNPLLLRDMPQPVSNFILHMRDEAHRFAISYHRLLNRRRIISK